MRILFVCENYLPHYGGVEVVFKNLAEKFVEEKNTVSLITHQLRGTQKKENIGGVDVNRIPSFHSRYVFTFSAIPSVFRFSKNTDIIQTTTFNGAFPAWLCAKLRRKPIVLTVHEVWQGKWKKITGFSRFKSYIHECLEKLIYILPFDHYVCVSDATKEDLLKIGIPHQKATTIHNGFDYHFWNPKEFSVSDREKIRKKLDFEKKYIYFSWGRPGPSKGFSTLLKAVPLIQERIPSALCVLMLSNVEMHEKTKKELFALIKKMKLEDKVRIVESLPYDQLKEYLVASDLVVIPSLSEGFGYTTLEAVAMEKPVVVSNIGSLPEVVSGKYQLFAAGDSNNLAEKVVKVSHNETMTKPLKHFLWKNSVNKYLTLYKELISKRKEASK